MPIKTKSGKWKWGNIERNSKQELVKTVYGIWKKNGSKGDFSNFLRGNHISENFGHALVAAQKNKNDEYYTRPQDAEKELNLFKHEFSGKKIFMNCDDPHKSELYKCFVKHFDEWNIKQVTAIGYKAGGQSKNSSEIISLNIKGDGSFLSKESQKYIKDCDIIFTNPPFSKLDGHKSNMFIEMLKLCISSRKKFAIIGPVIDLTFKDVYQAIIAGLVRITVKNCPRTFNVPTDDGSFEKKNVPCCIFTNFDINIPKLPSTKSINNITYYKPGNNSKLLQAFNDKDIIIINSIKDIPTDFNGYIGCPVSVLKYDLSDYEVKTFVSSIVTDSGNKIKNRFFIRKKI